MKKSTRKKRCTSKLVSPRCVPVHSTSVLIRRQDDYGQADENPGSITADAKPNGSNDEILTEDHPDIWDTTPMEAGVPVPLDFGATNGIDTVQQDLDVMLSSSGTESSVQLPMEQL